MTTTLRWHGYRYMPYEKRLAALEVARLTKQTPEPTADGFRVPCVVKPAVAKRFTYFAEVVDGEGGRLQTDQAMFEASISSAKQSTRYSAHGLHEYRGKFNPQVVRAAANILALKPGSVLLDPFCGSGTVLLEASHFGMDAIGFDLHPLAVEIANAKIEAYNAPRDELRRAADALLHTIADAIQERDEKRLSRWLDRSAPAIDDAIPNTEYLRNWFPELVLKQFAYLLSVINRDVPRRFQGIFRVILSDVVRDVSWQEPADLRIRRRAVEASNYPAIPLFADGVRKKAAAICATPPGDASTARQSALLVDSRCAAQASGSLRDALGRRRVDAVISSPPYATALPYVDMHRLSLCMLGLINDSQIRSAERALIGNREITDKERHALEDRLRMNLGRVPDSCHAFCLQMLTGAMKPGNGFRRRNTPALVYKYLEDMRAMFETLGGLMARGAPVAFVVGPNRCSLGGADFAINTPDLLRQVAEGTVFALDECIELDAYQRYDLHQQNSIKREVLLILRRT